MYNRFTFITVNTVAVNFRNNLCLTINQTNMTFSQSKYNQDDFDFNIHYYVILKFQKGSA